MSNLKSHNKIGLTVDVQGAYQEIIDNQDLFGSLPYRAIGRESPHKQMTDIWLRYGNLERFQKSLDVSVFKDKHTPQWFEWIYKFPHCLDIVKNVCDHVESRDLGMVLITRLDPGKEILPHKDYGWHAENFDKYYIPIYNKKGASFFFEDGVIEDPIEGEVWAFDNSVTHWVKNKSSDERIAMIVCVKQDKFDRGGKLCHQL